MPDDTRVLRLGSYGDRPAQDILRFLRTIKRAHDGILVMTELLEAVAIPTFRRRDEVVFGVVPGIELLGYWDVDDSQMQRYIHPRNELIVRSVVISSPGVWEFLGALNPLNFIIDLVKFRHTRRQDREFREEAERRSLELDNMLKENRVIRERLELVQEYGLPEQYQTALFNKLAITPLLELEAVQDDGMIFPAPDDGTSDDDDGPPDSRYSDSGLV